MGRPSPRTPSSLPNTSRLGALASGNVVAPAPRADAAGAASPPMRMRKRFPPSIPPARPIPMAGRRSRPRREESRSRRRRLPSRWTREPHSAWLPPRNGRPRRQPIRPPAAKLRRRWDSVRNHAGCRSSRSRTPSDPLPELMPRTVSPRHRRRKGQRPRPAPKEISVECRVNQSPLKRPDEAAVVGQPTEYLPGRRCRAEAGHVGEQRIQRCLDHLVVD